MIKPYFYKDNPIIDLDKVICIALIGTLDIQFTCDKRMMPSDITWTFETKIERDSIYNDVKITLGAKLPKTTQETIEEMAREMSNDYIAQHRMWLKSRKN